MVNKNKFQIRGNLNVKQIFGMRMNFLHIVQGTHFARFFEVIGVQILRGSHFKTKVVSRSNNSTHSGFEKYKFDLKFIIIQFEQFSYKS